MALCFPKSARLQRAAEFARLRHEGKSVHGKFMVLRVLCGGDAAPARIGIMTSRRVGGAVQRNRVRRRLRELVRVDRSRLIPNCWLVLIARSSAVEAGFDALREEWRALAKSGGVLHDRP